MSASKWPSGIPYIIGNEAAERYSFYGMKAILVIFLTQYIHNSSGELDPLDKHTAGFWYHLFVMASYILPFAGAFLSDILWGKYRTIMRLSLVYCLGHLVLALFETHMGFLVGCSLIALGAGGIKPCVSAHVGDQFDEQNSHLFERIFMYFYISINLGSVIAYASGEYLLTNYGPHIAFGLPGLLMAVATLFFYLGRNEFIAVKPAGWALYKEELFSAKGWALVKKLLPIYLFLAVFWSLYDQTGSTWVLQATSDLMDKHINLGFTSFEFLPSQIGFFNPLLIVLFTPLFSLMIYPFLRRYVRINYMRKAGVGMFVAVMAFGVVSWAQTQIDAGQTVSILWQVMGYVLLTAAEILISITILEFSYTQAPNSMKSFVMCFYLGSVSTGNGFTAMVELAFAKSSYLQSLDGAAYFWFFTILMLVAAIGFVIVNRNYQETQYVQSSSDYE